MTSPTNPISFESQQFSRITLITVILFVTVGTIALVLSLFYPSPVAKYLAIVIMFLLVPMSFVAHMQARKGNTDRAVGLMASVWYLISVGMIIVGDRLYGVLIVNATMPVLMALPFVSRSMFRWLISASVGLILVGSITRLFPPMYTSRVPDEIIADVESFAVTALTGVVMLSLWQSGGRLKAAAEGMRKAITALKESEKSLENKVEERTAELEQAFTEISNINEIATMVNSTLDLEDVKNTIYNGLQSLFSFDQMGVFLVDEDGEVLRLRQQAGRSFSKELHEALVDRGLPLDAKDSFAAACVVHGKSIFTGPITQEAVAQAGPTDKLVQQHNPLASILMCPLKIGENIIGCIFFAAQDEAFDLDEREINSIEHYVTQLSTAIRNAQLFQAAEKSRAEAETANETKGTFLANMSHEIRTPMNAIIGLTGLCLETELTNKQDDYLTKVDGAANALRIIIDDILDFSKLEAGKFEFENIPFSLNDVLDNLATICMVRCQDKHLELVFQRDPALPDTLTGDPTRLGQILINLAGNAIKFTEEGQIVVAVRQTERVDDRVTVYFDVRDSGIGMNEEQLGRLFQSFSQADSTISRQYGGTGLGLAISQQLAEMMGGLIEVSSQPGVGSSFHFTLSFDVAELEEPAVSREEAPQGLNVLVVDDNDLSLEILQEYLVSFGYTVTLAESGERALALMQPEHDFDLVLLDWMMPGMTGLDVALAIREGPSPPKIILLSSWTMPSSEHRKNVDAFLAKPIKPSALLDTIMLAYGKQVVRRARKLGSSTGPEDLVAIRGARVLVVDDSDINLQIACELLEKVPLVLETACDGEEAVAKTLANDYDCVLMDIQMPGMDGYTATAVIRETYPTGTLPILAMTANVMAEDRARTREAGMDGHVAKPVDPADLYKALAEAIPEADYSANIQGPENGETAEDKTPDASADVASLPDFMPGLDIKQGLSRLANNEKLFLQLLTDMIKEYAQSAIEMQSLVDAGDSSTIRGAAHKIRGIASNLGATMIGASAEAIEKTVLAGEAVEAALIENLAKALDLTTQSHIKLMEQRVSVRIEGKTSDVDLKEVFAKLQNAVAEFDPGATDLIDELLATQADDSDMKQQLVKAREMLDSFNFADAGPLLDELATEWQT